MLNVFITVDTEVVPRRGDLSRSAFLEDMRRDIYGVSREGEFGLRFQLDLLNEFGLKAVFFVESLFACAMGLDLLRDIVDTIQEGGHEVQLHLHTEWLEKMPHPTLRGRLGQHIRDFSEEEQTVLIAQGLANLRACGVEKVCAFRAGNYGANFETLRALARNGILYDTSYNTCYLDSACRMRTEEPLLQPKKMDGVYEFPISFFQDRPRHYRHAEVCACSAAELENALMKAWKEGWYSFVIVSHSFELIKRRKDGGSTACPDRIVIKRFERLCRFLAKNRDKFFMASFSELVPEVIPQTNTTRIIRSHWFRTARRLGEQLRRRLFFRALD